MAAWQLFNFLELTAQDRGKPLLRINLDETRIGLHFSGPRGLQARAVSRAAAKAKAKRRRPVIQNVPLGKRRAGFTHVALICDDASLQPRLPQILLGNEAVFPVATLDALRPTLPPNVQLWRRKSGWVNKGLLREIVRELSAALGELTATRTVVLLLDTASMHICQYFINMAARHGICVQYIPAKMTWLLQPLDTHAFARYKLHLVQQYRNCLLQSARGQSELPAVIQAVVSAIRKVLQGVAWDYAFDGNGFSAHGQGNLRSTILEEMDWTHAPELPARLPDFGDLSAVFPTRTEIPLAALLRFYRDQPAEPPAAEEPVAQPPAELPAGGPLPHPWFGRLRSSSHLVAPAPASPQPPPLPPPVAAPPVPPPMVEDRAPVYGPPLPPHLRQPAGRRLPVLRPLARRANPAHAAASVLTGMRCPP